MAEAQDLHAACEEDTVLEVRTSRMKRMAGLEIESGIDKQKRTTSLHLGALGFEEDEHDLTFHGGPDKAILGYCRAHYAGWRETYPDRAAKFVPGGFGENFVLGRMNERNVCIGDVVAVGGAQLQVSLPRQPCFKLNHRFELKRFAPETSRTSRTGWYYRVVQPGTVAVGDRVRLVKRPWPQWTIERIQHYLHRDTDDLAMNEELSLVQDLGAESRNQFANRVAKAKLKLAAEKEDWRDFKIVARRLETPRILALTLQLPTPFDKTDELDPGVHARLKLPNGLTRSYSVVSGTCSADVAESLNRFELGIALADDSRGGSRYLHSAKVGDVLQVGRATGSVPMAGDASNRVFIAGGIGITAFLALADVCRRIHWSFQLHYAVRSADDIPFRDRLSQLGDSVLYYDKAKGERMDVEHIIGNMPWNSRLYVCGPDRMMEAAQTAVQKCGIPENEVHYEAFAADVTGDPFEAKVANKEDKTVKIGENESLLEVLRREFLEMPSSCEVGNCGTCKVTLKCGEVKHRGTALTAEEKKTSMLSCVSRGVGHIEIEI